MGYAPDATIAAMRGQFNMGVFFRAMTDPPLRLSFSTDDVPIAMPADPSDAVYNASGRLMNIPDLEILINGLADTATFSLSGLDAQATQLMLDGAPDVLGVPVTIGIAPLDERWQPAAPVVLVWSGTAELIEEAMQLETDPTKNQTQTLSLTCRIGDQSRQFQNLLTYSPQTQHMLSPGDTFCDDTPRYQPGIQVSWPRY